MHVSFLPIFLTIRAVTLMGNSLETVVGNGAIVNNVYSFFSPSRHSTILSVSIVGKKFKMHFGHKRPKSKAQIRNIHLKILEI